MCRFVIVCIFISCVSFGVLAQEATNATKRCNKDDPELNAAKLELRNCFNSTVQRHLHPEETTGECLTADDFGHKIHNYIAFVNTKCHKNISLDTTNLIKLIDYSLQNDSFKRFYEGIDCLKNVEYNISNICVKGRLGFFNITKERKHTTWVAKANVVYSRSSCSLNEKVGDCVQALLTTCIVSTGQYMANLFEYARQLGNCSSYPDISPIPPASGNQSAGGSAAPWLTTPICLLAVLMHVCVQKLKFR